MFFAVLVSSLALAIGVAIYDLVVRELALSQTAAQSQYAIYAADSGAECALYWDSKAPLLGGIPSIFPTSSASALPVASTFPGGGIWCAGQDILKGATLSRGLTSATSTFTISLGSSAAGPSAIVVVGKYLDAKNILHTLVVSHGFNTGTTNAIGRVERILQLSY